MKRLLPILLLSVVLCSCDKDEPELTECQRKNIGYITLINNSNHAFDVWINNTYYKHQPGKTKSNKIEYSSGRTYQIYVKQISGYVFYPTEHTFNITLNMCDEKTVSFTD